MCDQETSNTRRLKPATGLWKYNHSGLQRQENKQRNRHFKQSVYFLEGSMFAGIKYLVLLFCFIQIVATGSNKIGLEKIFGPKKKAATRDWENCLVLSYKISVHIIVLEW